MLDGFVKKKKVGDLGSKKSESWIFGFQTVLKSKLTLITYSNAALHLPGSCPPPYFIKNRCIYHHYYLDSQCEKT